MKIDGSALEEKYSFKMLRLSFSSKFECGSYIITNVAKTSSKKKCNLQISIILPYGFAWNTVVMSGLVLLASAWKC